MPMNSLLYAITANTTDDGLKLSENGLKISDKHVVNMWTFYRTLFLFFHSIILSSYLSVLLSFYNSYILQSSILIFFNHSILIFFNHSILKYSSIILFLYSSIILLKLPNNRIKQTRLGLICILTFNLLVFKLNEPVN